MFTTKVFDNNIHISCFIAIFLFLLAGCFASCKKEKIEETCKPAVASEGHLSYTNPAGPFTFRTRGGGTIVIDSMLFVTIKHDNYPNLKIELWGGLTVNGQAQVSDNHEGLNGKHIKDRIGSRRTIIFPDGTKITIVADGEQGRLLSISIYDSSESHYINPACQQLEHSSTNASIAKQLDDAEADGETATFEFTSTGLFFVNIYTEDTPGNKVINRVLLGELDRNNPNNVRDYYDDPRLAHT